MSSTLEKSNTSVHQHEAPAPSVAELYRHDFFSREAAAARKALIPTLILPLVYNAILLLACLSLFLGSLLKSSDISRISVVAVNLDDGTFGSALISSIKKGVESQGPHLRWHFFDHPTSVDDAWSRQMVLEEKYWAVLQVSSNASYNLATALEQGNPSYDPLSAVTLYFASARNQVTSLSLTVPAIMGQLNGIISRITINTTASYLQSNADRIPAEALKCPQCLTTPFSIRQIDLIPFSPAVAFGTLNTGMIFLLTFTFNIFTILRSGAELYGHIFTLRTMLTLRTLTSLLAYLFLALTYTIGILAFQIPLTGHFHSRAAGFMALWMLNWLTMGACGLVMESIFTLIGMQWAPFFLNVWLISNASGAFGSFEAMPRFYQYGYAMPFFHAGQATRTIVFGTKSHLGANFGVLVAWCVLGWLGMAGFTTWRVLGGRKRGVHVVP